jgi:hypothetical protein
MTPQRWRLYDPYGELHFIEHRHTISGHEDDGWFGFGNVGHWLSTPKQEVLITAIIRAIVRAPWDQHSSEGFTWTRQS